MFSSQERMHLRKNQVVEVICQLRFPEILMIEAKLPAEFQELIREEYPQYSVRKERSAQKLMTPQDNHKQETYNNYSFVSADGAWRINLTSTFISLSCTSYTGWETFAKHLDKPLAAFIKLYKPAYFTRIGLRYVNFISRKALELTDIPFRDLINPTYLGPLGLENVSEASVAKSSIDADLAIGNGCRSKIHAGPGLVQRNGVADKEIKFIFDLDLFMNGNTQINISTAVLNTLHDKAWPIFRYAITDTLYESMEPTFV